MSTGSFAWEDREPRRTPAQWFCLLFGAGLLLLGALGFFVNATFGEAALGFDLDDPEDLNGDLFLGLEVNGWHNVVHMASGVLLLGAGLSGPTAKAVAIAFGVVYGLVALIGFLDGTDVLEFIAVNTVDNIFHVVIAVIGVVVGIASPAREYKRAEHASRRATG